MKQLKEKIRQSGLKQNWIADKVGIGNSHLTMMLNGNAKMSDEVEDNINKILEKILVH